MVSRASTAGRTWSKRRQSRGLRRKGFSASVFRPDHVRKADSRNLPTCFRSWSLSFMSHPHRRRCGVRIDGKKVSSEIETSSLRHFRGRLMALCRSAISRPPRFIKLARKGRVVKYLKSPRPVATCVLVFSRISFSSTIVTIAFKSVFAGLAVVLLLLELPTQSQGESTRRLRRRSRLVDLENTA